MKRMWRPWRKGWDTRTAMHHFVAKSEWSDDEMLRRVREWIGPKLGGGRLLDRRRQRVSEARPTLGGRGAAGLRGSWAKSWSRASGGTAGAHCETAALERQGAGTGPFRNRRTTPCAGLRERTRCCLAALPRCGSAMPAAMSGVPDCGGSSGCRSNGRTIWRRR